MNITSLKKTFLNFIKKMIKCPECEGLFKECLVCQNKKTKIKVKNTKFSIKSFKDDADKELSKCFHTAQYIDKILQENIERNKSNFDIGNKIFSSYKDNDIQLDLFKGAYKLNEEFINHNVMANSDFLKDSKSLAKRVKELPNKVNNDDFMLYLMYKEDLKLLIARKNESIKRLEEMLKSIGDNLRKNVFLLKEYEK